MHHILVSSMTFQKILKSRATLLKKIKILYALGKKLQEKVLKEEFRKKHCLPWKTKKCEKISI